MKKSKNTELRIAGFGGQGVILAGYIIGKAAAIYDDKHSTLIQSFGPEARGSACSAGVMISEDPILYPYITTPNVSVILSKEAFEKFEGELEDGGIMLVEKELVELHKTKKKRSIYSIPATRLAEDMGRKIVMNIIVVGFFAATTGIISHDAARKAVETSVPPGTEELNLKAFDCGFEYGQKLLAEQKSQKVKAKAEK